jgi:hypothetical protein
MSRIVHFMLGAVLFVGIAGCNASVKEQGAAKPSDTPTPDADQKAQMAKQQQYYEASKTPPAGDAK